MFYRWELCKAIANQEIQLFRELTRLFGLTSDSFHTFSRLLVYHRLPSPHHIYGTSLLSHVCFLQSVPTTNIASLSSKAISAKDFLHAKIEQLLFNSLILIPQDRVKVICEHLPYTIQSGTLSFHSLDCIIEHVV